MRQNEAYRTIFCTFKLLPVLYFYLRLCDPTLLQTEMISEPVGLVSKSIPAHL